MINKNNIVVSVPDKSDVIIGQRIILDITITLESKTTFDSHIEIKNTVNVTPSENKIDIPSGATSYIKSIELKITNNIKYGDNISFDIIPDASLNIPERTIHYTARTIDFTTLQLYFEKDLIPTVESGVINSPQNNGISYTLANAIVKDGNNKPLNNTPIAISSASQHGLSDVSLYTYKGKTETAKKQIDDVDTIFVNTDENGKLEFYIYPNQTMKESVFSLQSSILDVSPFIKSINEIYIIDTNKNSPMGEHPLFPPTISESEGGILTSINGSSTFSVMIYHYQNANVGDEILFFVDKAYSHQKIELKYLNNLSTYFIQLPYDILPVNKPVSLYYIVVSIDGKIRHSYGEYVKYIGGTNKNHPMGNVTRIYEPCSVYSSYSSLNEIPGNKYNLVYPGDILNYSVIANYINNPDQAALFVHIIGSNDPDNSKALPFGATGKLILYIESYNKPINQPISFTIPTKPDEEGGNTATAVIYIKYKYVSHVTTYPYSGNPPGNIYFEYQFTSDDGTVAYSKTWQARIDTERPGDDDDAVILS